MKAGRQRSRMFIHQERVQLTVLICLFLSGTVFAGSREDLVIKLGSGGFLDYLKTPHDPALSYPDKSELAGAIAAYTQSTGGEGGAAMRVTVKVTGPSVSYSAMKSEFMGATSQSIQAGDEAVFYNANPGDNWDLMRYLGRVGKYVVYLETFDDQSKKGVDGRMHFLSLMGILSRGDAGGAGKYKELIAVLRTYKPSLFRDFTDVTLEAALESRRTSALLGGDGVTVDLEKWMMTDIEKFTRLVDTPLAVGEKSWVNSKYKTEDFKDLLWDILDRIKDRLPETCEKLVGVVGYFREVHAGMVSIRDAYIIPAIADDLYSAYRSHRGTGNDEADVIVYDTYVAHGKAIGLVRSSPVYTALSDESFTTAFREKLEARYQLDRFEVARVDMAKNKSAIIGRIVGMYDDKIGLIHNTCEQLKKK